MTPSLVLRRYQGLTCVESRSVAGAGTCSFAGATRRIGFEDRDGKSRVTAGLTEGEAAQVQLALEFQLECCIGDDGSVLMREGTI